MNARIWVKEVEFNDGTKLSLEKRDIVVFVGPNNAGKSASLKEMLSMIKDRKLKSKAKVIENITTEILGGDAEVHSFLKSKAIERITSNPEPLYDGNRFNVYLPNAKQWWRDHNNGIQEMLYAFADSLDTEERLAVAKPPKSIDILRESLTHPIHHLQEDDNLEREFNDYFRQAFDTDLMVYRGGGKEVLLFVGDKPSLEEGEDRVSKGYLEKVRLLDLLHEQGDGMRSFVGVLLSAFVSSHSILFIDEPEAFLHPPQARLLGKMLASDLPKERQLFLATHSEEFLKGLLDTDSEKLKIIRIQREGKVNKIRVLNNADIKELWADSLLRHSNILSGLFHSQVIVCESDSDCRFYSAITSSVYNDKSEMAPDILFVHCGGKHRIPTVVEALYKVDVRIKVVADFDLLSDVKPLKEIYTNLGGDWETVKKDWNTVKLSIDKQKPQLELNDLKSDIIKILDEIETEIVTKEDLSKIHKTLKKASTWSLAKSMGKTYIPSGTANQAYKRLIKKLNQQGLFIVEVGELEGFDKSIGNHGPKWVSAVLQKDLNSEEFDEAKNFVKTILARE